MAYIPIPKSPTSNKSELLSSIIRSFNFHLQEKDGLSETESENRLKSKNETQLLQLHEEFLRSYDRDLTFYIRQSLKFCYAKDKKVGLMKHDINLYIKDLKETLNKK